MSVKPGLTRNRRRERETPEYAGMVRRVIMAHGRRVGEADPEDLSELRDMRQVVEAAIAEGIRGQRARGASWADIGRGLGISRQAAYATWSWVDSLAS
ncbi:MAG: hypothetical protein QM708_13480 [Propioniciclava sp.]|uniref:hypothetical protein n=1 Tax=Propioniciclava sp. TaxID=2038686 RepID=UPI0039E6B9AA